MTDTSVIHPCDCIVECCAWLIRVYVSMSVCFLCMCVFIACAPINQNLSLVPNGDRLSSRETRDVSVPRECLFFVCPCVSVYVCVCMCGYVCVRAHVI